MPRALVEMVILQATLLADDPAARRLALAKWILSGRRRRSKMFRTIRFGEPSWDMILDLYIAEHEGRRVDVSGLCLASGVASTTALRYVELLVDDALIAKVDDTDDGRRSFVTISDTLRAAIDEWLDQATAGLTVAGLSRSASAVSDHN
nr:MULTISPECIES: MarR family transcriptional regulator [unclassified Sphingomonas]